ncbi:MAG TPA: c-type cytochrome domain-containing protein, partial [Candidatus Saccharimonadales bacterium]|nr:c-type cytochrome domain-containing protein [Candidatus Saccharimonadales bacterium]
MTQKWLQLFVVNLSLVSGMCVRGAETAVQYNRDIRPILSDRCFKCHGPDKGSRKAGLRLDQPESAFGPRKDPAEHAIVPGHPGQSLMVRRIFAQDTDDIMPPPASYLSLTAAEKETLRTWIAQGAKYEPHWAFIALPPAVAVPAVSDRKWPRNEIDHFIAARLEKAGLKPSREAGKTRWLRRATYDLNGLPPTPAEVDAFLADTS